MTRETVKCWEGKRVRDLLKCECVGAREGRRKIEIRGKDLGFGNVKVVERRGECFGKRKV